MTWLAGINGRRVDLLHPTPEAVDFEEIAWSLAHINRYVGHPTVPVSVGLHTLIVFDAAPPTLKAHALLHDAHEARLGDTATPIKEAWLACATELYGDVGRQAVAQVRRRLETRHDQAIWKAAGLAPPTAFELAGLKRLDIAALATERRDFWSRPASAPRWADLIEQTQPLPRVWRFKAPDRVADELLAAFRQWLPALRRQAA